MISIRISWVICYFFVEFFVSKSSVSFMPVVLDFDHYNCTSLVYFCYWNIITLTYLFIEHPFHFCGGCFFWTSVNYFFNFRFFVECYYELLNSVMGLSRGCVFFNVLWALFFQLTHVHLFRIEICYIFRELGRSCICFNSLNSLHVNAFVDIFCAVNGFSNVINSC